MILYLFYSTQFALSIAVNSAKISVSGQTCGQVRKMGLFNPRNRGEQARFICCENARFQEIMRGNKRKIGGSVEPPILEGTHIKDTHLKAVQRCNTET